MSNQEQAFIYWYENQSTFGVDLDVVWDAACKWQRVRDAEICRSRVDPEWPNDDISMESLGCANAILEQGE